MVTSAIRTNTGYIFMAVFAIVIGLYPLRFIYMPTSEGLLASKSAELLAASLYLPAFYTHIFLGGLALIVGFSQFFPKLRRKRLGLHRALGKIYLLSVFLSGIAALGISFFATGGIIPAMGFGMLALAWLYTTTKAYTSVKKRDIASHQKWMIRSYALCFAAVTLRIYLPVFLGLLGMEFVPAYKIIAWLCWVPNLVLAELFIVRKLPGTQAT